MTSEWTMGDWLAWADKTARAVAHANMPRCTGGTGHGPGGDGPRWHSAKCDALAADILNAMRSGLHHARGMASSDPREAREVERQERDHDAV